ncbi:MAG: hypothetical protein K6D61_04375 [Prevotella sp.]|nr:hypothetical protein [Prevotella sp.]
MKQFKHKTLLARAAMTLLAMLCFLGGARAQQALPYEYGFEDNNLATDGWTALITSTSSGINNAAAHEGSYGFRFNYSEQNASLISPVLTGGDKVIDVSFWYKESSASYGDEQFYVGYTTDENVTDPESFTYGDIITASLEWQKYENSFPPGTKRIAIKYVYNDAFYLFLDDFSFEAVSSCNKPSNLNVDYTEGSNTATVTWEGEASSYNIDVNGTVTNGVTSPYTINNLQPATTYTVKLQSDCGEEQSAWALAGSFTTPCDAYVIPYAYGFEDAGAMDCWSMVNIPSDCEGLTGLQNNAWAESNLNKDYARSGNNFFFFMYYAYSEQGVPFQTLISPELSGISNGLHVEFYYSGFNNGIETFKVGYSTTDNNLESFTWGNEITASSSYQRFSANYPAGTKYVAVQHTSDDQYYLFLDDFLFEESASCLEPSGLTISDATTTGATLSWTAGGSETAWDIFVTDDATVVPGEATTPTISGVDANTYNLTALNPCTIYYVYVRSACSSTDASAWSSPVIFHTECEPMALPYSYDFEDDDLPVSWSTIIENTSYTGINLMSTTETNQVLAFYMGTSQNPALVAVLPEVDVANYPLNRYQITFDACYANTSSSNMTAGKLAIGIMTDPTDASTFELVEEVDITDSYSTFGSHTVWLNSYTGNGHYIALKDIYTQSGYVLVDNVEVTALPSCIPPTNLNITGGANAVLTWEGTAESFDIACSQNSNAEPENVIVGRNVTAKTFDLSSFVSVGDNFVWVRANCSETEHSEWVAISFNVGYCTPNPTSHDSSGITGVSFGTGDYVVTNGDGSASLPASAPYYGDYTSMIGAVQAGVESTIAITTGTGSYPYTFVIWVDLDNSMTFEDSEILHIGKASTGNGTYNATITIPATHATGDYRMRIYGADSYFSSFYNNGTTNWEAAHDPCSSGSYRHAHDYTLRVLEAPSCLAAASVTFEDITSTSAVISWTNNNGVEATYTVMQGETVLTTTAVDSYTLTGLTAATSYPAGTFTIISNCDETMIANVPAFTTSCGVIATFPWSVDFEGYNSNTVPMCWDNSASTSLTAGTSNAYYIWGVVTVSGNNMIKMENFWAKTGTALINTPTIVLPSEGAYYLTFDYAHNATCGAFAVKVSEDGGTSFTELASYTKGSGSSNTEPGEFTPATISLADYAGKSIMLQFFANANYGSGAIFVDNVKVGPIANIHFAKEGYATYYNSGYDVVLPAGMKAKIVTASASDGTLTYETIADGSGTVKNVPSKTAVMLQVAPAADNQTIFVDLATATTGTYTGNKLHGSDTRVDITTLDDYSADDNYYYMLSYDTSGANIGWYWDKDNTAGTGFWSEAHKAWLVLPKSLFQGSGAPFLGLPGWEDTTGIVPVGVNPEDGEWYTLQGLKIGKKPSTAGVYIHNGRKVVIK